MQGIKHYLIDEFEPDDEFNVNVFQKLTKKYINEIYEKGKTPIIVGGTGFYIQSVLYDIDFDETEDNHEYRKTLEQIYKDKGVQYLYNMLKEVDEESAKAIHYNNVKRVIGLLNIIIRQERRFQTIIKNSVNMLLHIILNILF